MSWIKAPMLWVLVLAIAMLWVAWETRIFGYLLFCAFFSLIGVSLYRRSLARIFLPITVTVGLLGVAEFALPFLAKPLKEKSGVLYDPDSDYSRGYIKRINGFGHIPRKGVHTSRKLSKDGELIYDVIYTIGEDGFRISGAKENFSVFLFGGSFAMGEGLNDNETLSYFLWKDHQVSVKNLGIHGYGLHQALYSISVNHLSAENGVNLVLTTPWHALRSACKPSYAAGTPKYVVKNGYAELDGVCSDESESFVVRLLKRSNIAQLVSVIFEKKEEITNEDIELYLSILRSIKMHTDANNSKLVIAYIDAEDYRLEKTKYTNESLIKDLSKIADQVIDATLADSREDLDIKYYLHKLDQHPSAIANSTRSALLAPSIKSFLQQKF